MIYVLHYAGLAILVAARSFAIADCAGAAMVTPPTSQADNGAKVVELQQGAIGETSLDDALGLVSRRGDSPSPLPPASPSAVTHVRRGSSKLLINSNPFDLANQYLRKVEWEIVEISGADRSSRRHEILLADAWTDYRWKYVEEGSGPRLGLSLSDDGRIALTDGATMSNDEHKFVEDFAARLRRGDPIERLRLTKARRELHLEGAQADLVVADLLEFFPSEVRGSSIYVSMIDDSPASATVSGQAEIKFADVWFETNLEVSRPRALKAGAVERITVNAKGKNIRGKYPARSWFVEYETTVERAKRSAPLAPQEADDLAGVWERSGDDFAGMRIEFRQVGDDWYGFLTAVPVEARKGVWREGQIKLRSPRAHNDGSFELLSLTYDEYGQPYYSSGTAQFRGNDVLLWSDKAGAMAGPGWRQTWKRVE